MDTGPRVLTSLLALTAMGLLLSTEPTGKEISWQEFVTGLLESGEVCACACACVCVCLCRSEGGKVEVRPCVDDGSSIVLACRVGP
jgi:hypothetical protein